MKTHLDKILGFKYSRSLNNSPVVKFEGGLGSQLLAAMDLALINRKPIDAIVRIDDHYFEYAEIERNVNGLSFWNWELDRYGIHRNSFGGMRIKKGQSSLIRPLNLSLDSQEHALFIKENADIIFPVDKSKLQRNLERLDLFEGFSVIHIRRGDYSKIGAHETSLEDYLKLIPKIKELLVGKILLSSDSLIPPGFIKGLEEIFNSSREIVTLEDFNPGEVHDLMRNSDVLIASNSTFSITAGMTAKSSNITFAPLGYAFPLTKHNSANQFLALGSFYLLH